MKITIDNKEILVKDPEMNIVAIADAHKITIPAPCYRSKKKNGCCNACVVEVDGLQKYACATKPEDGMHITFKRPDLDKIRKERLEKYAQAIQSGGLSANTCGGSNPVNLTTKPSSCGCSNTSCCS